MQRAQPDDIQEVPILLLGNKIDLENERKIMKEDAQKYCEDEGSNLIFYETSAKDSTNVIDAYPELARRALAIQERQ